MLRLIADVVLLQRLAHLVGGAAGVEISLEQVVHVGLRHGVDREAIHLAVLEQSRMLAVILLLVGQQQGRARVHHPLRVGLGEDLPARALQRCNRCRIAVQAILHRRLHQQFLIDQRIDGLPGDLRGERLRIERIQRLIQL